MAKHKVSHAATKPKATTQDIVGNRSDAGQNRGSAKWRKNYERLVQLRDELLERQTGIGHLAREESPSFSTHMADAATDTFDRDLALGMLSSEQNSVYAIEQALDRIRSGTYGICELTGKPIERERLEAVPWARFSMAAERSIEEEAGRSRTRLGQREGLRGGTTQEEAQQPPEEDA